MVEYNAKGCSTEAMRIPAASRSISDLLKESKANWMALVDKYSARLSDEFKDNLLNEIERITMQDAWMDNDVPVTKGAAHAFMILLANLKPSIFPGVSCDYKGHVIMHWKRGNNDAWFKCYSISKVKWVVSTKEGVIRFDVRGNDSVRKVLSDLKSLKILNRNLFAK